MAAMSVPRTMAVPLTEVEDGTLRVAGTRVSLDSIVCAYWAGASPEEIHQRFTTVSAVDAYAVISFYLQNRAEIDAYLRGREQETEELRRAAERRWPLHRLRERLLVHRAAPR
ncbi:MAG: DUF433 domain-containing protein [Chloroflexota bacterium]